MLRSGMESITRLYHHMERPRTATELQHADTAEPGSPGHRAQAVSADSAARMRLASGEVVLAADRSRTTASSAASGRANR